MNFLKNFLKGKGTYLMGFSAIFGGLANITAKLAGHETGVGFQESITAIWGGLTVVFLRRANNK